MFVRCTEIADGPGPSEAIVGIRTADGTQEEVVLSKRSIHNHLVEIGSPLLTESGKSLIELPRESLSGRWRIWVPASDVVEMPVAAE